MKKEESLIEFKESKFKKFLDSIKGFFCNLFKKNKNIPIAVENKNNVQEIKKEETTSPEVNAAQTMQDMEILGKVVKGEIKSSSLEPEVQERLIQLCRKRRMEIREKIKQTDEKIAKINQLLLEIEEIKKM
jgi:hypothetical protein